MQQQQRPMCWVPRISKALAETPVAGTDQAPPPAPGSSQLSRHPIEANLKQVTVTLATWDGVWEVYLDQVGMAAAEAVRSPGPCAGQFLGQFFKKLVVFFGAVGIGTRGGWGADAVLRACCKVVCRPKGIGQRRGRVVLEDEHHTSQVSSAMNSPQPCVKEMDRSKPTRPEDWKPQPGGNTKGKEYPALGFNKLRDQAPKTQSQQPVAHHEDSTSALGAPMPLYELMCLAKPALARPLMVEMMKRVGKLVSEKGGVVTDIKSFGDQHLAYDIRRPYERLQAHIWQMTVMTGPAALREVLTELRNNDNVLRYISIKRDSQLSLVPHYVNTATSTGAAQAMHDLLIDNMPM
ncbi:hypothetical protein QJQ45_028272 [Haematococcus lacustris]|nr:hypothetical protein QJQ45_028272 [Haematococcus lacustris]